MKISQWIAPLLLGLITACNNNPETSTEPLSHTDTTLVVPIPAQEKAAVNSQQDGGFEDVDTDAFNAKLAENRKSLSPKEVIQFYYPAVIQEGDKSFQKIDIDSKVEGNKTIVTLTHDNQPHISIQGHRIVMEMEKKGGKWEVLSIKQQFKCWVRLKEEVVWGSKRCEAK